MIIIPDNINDIKDVAREVISSGGSVFFSEKVSINNYTKTQNQNDVQAASANPNTLYFGPNEGTVLGAFAFVPQMYYGYVTISASFNSWAAGTIVNLTASTTMYRIDGGIVTVNLPFGGTVRNPDPGTPIVVTALSQFNYQSARPILFNAIGIAITPGAASTWSLGIAVSFTGYRFIAC
jgi:hypothetical protein